MSNAAPRMSRPTRTLLRSAPLLLLAACTQDTAIIKQKVVLTSDPLVDAGAVAVSDAYTLGVDLRSMGQAPVVVDAITIEDDPSSAAGGAFVLQPWQNDGDQAVIAGGSEASPTVYTVRVSFRPTVVGYFRALMTIHSNDNQIQGGLWKVALRGMAAYPCASLAPLFLDFGERPAGGCFTESVSLANCGPVTVTVGAFTLVSPSGAFTVWTVPPVYVVPGATETIEFGWIVPEDPEPDAAVFTIDTNDVSLAGTVQAIGNDCSASTDASWDADGDGWLSCGGDCDDGLAGAGANPSEIEQKDGRDNDCDGVSDEPANPPDDDADGDGWTEFDGDCDDADGTVRPGAWEAFNQVDDDCNGLVDDTTDAFDDDGDGLSEREGDCDDTVAATCPGAAEDPSNLVDDDCDGETDEGSAASDDDGDGFSEDDGDCDDVDPWALPGGQEDCDGADNDCDGTADEDDACRYLVERDEDTGTGEDSSCAAAPGPRRAWAALAALALLLAARRRR